MESRSRPIMDAPEEQGRVRRLFLTGGTGLVGSHVASRFREKGTTVRALHRSSSDTSYLESIGCDLVEGDIRDDPDVLAVAMKGCDALVHAASLVYADLPWPRVRAINVEGTGGVFRGAVAAGIPRAVHLSSVAVYGIPEGEVDEASPTDRPLRPRERYARSKREAEAVVREVAESAASLQVALLRPTAIYGERDRLFTLRMAGHLERRRQLLLGSGRTPLPLVYAGNLADAVEAALTRPLPERIRAYNVTGTAPISQRDFYGALARALGTRTRFVPIPGSLVRLGARAADALGLQLPGMEEVPFTRVALLATRPNPYRAERIRDELGWVPEVDGEEAVRRTAEWLARERES
jgi:2-alkyl-3-oxoalkanoate reductase